METDVQADKEKFEALTEKYGEKTMRKINNDTLLNFHCSAEIRDNHVTRDFIENRFTGGTSLNSVYMAVEMDNGKVYAFGSVFFEDSFLDGSFAKKVREGLIEENEYSLDVVRVWSYDPHEAIWDGVLNRLERGKVTIFKEFKLR